MAEVGLTHAPTVVSGNLRPWVKGQSGNPGGRISQLTRMIRSKTKSGEELADFALQVLRGKITTTVVLKDGITTAELGPTIGERLQALSYLSEYSYPKVKDAPDEQAEESVVTYVIGALQRRGVIPPQLPEALKETPCEPQSEPVP